MFLRGAHRAGGGKSVSAMIRLSTMIRLGLEYVFLILRRGAHWAGGGKIRLGPGDIGLLGSGAHRAGVGKIRLGPGILILL